MERVEPSESNVTANPPSPQLGSFDSATVAATLQGRLSLIIRFSIHFCTELNQKYLPINQILEKLHWRWLIHLSCATAVT
jgi:hypothetical protein